MSHTPHSQLSGYDARQILVDGCHECDWRASHVEATIAVLDEQTFERAWRRASDWNRDEPVGRVSSNEVRLLRILWAVQAKLERRGVPLGQCPGY